LGASISTGQAQLIAQRTDKVFVMGDGDKAGEIMNSEIESLFFARYNIKVQTIPVAEGKDGGSLTLPEVLSTMPPAVMLGAVDRGNKLDLVGSVAMV
jgi:DNA primase